MRILEEKANILFDEYKKLYETIIFHILVIMKVALAVATFGIKMMGDLRQHGSLEKMLIKREELIRDRGVQLT